MKQNKEYSADTITTSCYTLCLGKEETFSKNEESDEDPLRLLW